MKFTFLALAALTLSLHAGDAPSTETKTIDLFNGKDLTGWKIVGGKGTFKVEDNCIVGTG